MGRKRICASGIAKNPDLVWDGLEAAAVDLTDDTECGALQMSEPREAHLGKRL